MTPFSKPFNDLELRSPDFPHTPPLFPNCFPCLGWGNEKGSESQAASGGSDNEEQAPAPGLGPARSGYPEKVSVFL